MPSIEIICIGQSHPSEFGELPFAVEAENHLSSHRGSSSLFQKDFDRLTGCIYHLGNPYLKVPNAPGCYFASDLLEEWWERLEFKAEYVPSVKRLSNPCLLPRQKDGYWSRAIISLDHTQEDDLGSGGHSINSGGYMICICFT